MKVIIESLDECAEAAKEIRRYLWHSAKQMGHDYQLCPCKLCAAIRSQESVEVEIRQFKRN